MEFYDGEHAFAFLVNKKFPAKAIEAMKAPEDQTVDSINEVLSLAEIICPLVL